MTTPLLPTVRGSVARAGDLDGIIAGLARTRTHLEAYNTSGGRARILRTVAEGTDVWGYEANGDGHILTGAYVIVDSRRVQVCFSCGSPYSPCDCGRDV